MEYRSLHAGGQQVSLLGYGCMRFPQTADGKIDEERALPLLERAFAAGVNYYDTAWPYHNGQSEEFVGRAFVTGHPREQFYLATKLPCWEVKSVGDAERIFTKQLEKLHTDYVDFYLLHALNRGSFRKMAELGIPEYLLQQKEAGKIRNLGFSFHDDYEAFEEIIGYWAHWDFCQIQLNYMDRDEQAGLRGYALAASKNIPLVIMEPIKGGSLAALPPDISAPLRKLRPDASDSSWALRYLADMENVKVVLSGMSTMEQLEDNLATYAEPDRLSERELETLLSVSEALRQRTRNGCTGCGYCMPCPMGVDIPANFRIWNTYYRYQNAGEARWKWSQLAEGETGAQCVECGKCEAVCPQKLPIRRDLKAAYEELAHL